MKTPLRIGSDRKLFRIYKNPHRTGVMRSRVISAGVIAAFLTLPSVSHAGVVAGQYRCSNYDIEGAGVPCWVSSPLILRSDGTYQVAAEKGTWRQQSGTVTFSEPNIRGSGRLGAQNQIVFSYALDGARRTVTYQCENCAAP